MQTLRVDKQKNRLYIVLSGFVDAEEMKANSDETIEVTKQLKPGFDVITDISNFKPTTPEATKHIERVQANFKAAGVRRGVRVVGESAITAMQFSRTGKHVGYESHNVATLAEAEKLLDG
jgi:hypothetical protein